MEIYIHLVKPVDFPYPTRDWIIEECQRVTDTTYTISEYNRLKQDVTLTEEVGEPARYECVVDYEETNIDEDTGLPQPAKVTFSGVLY